MTDLFEQGVIYEDVYIVLPKIQANNAHAADALMLDIEGYVSETNATNVFIVKDGNLYTPFADSCLPGVISIIGLFIVLVCICIGITRGIVMKIAQAHNIQCKEKRISLTECYAADEMFTTGTMGEITPVRILDGRTLRNFIQGK